MRKKSEGGKVCQNPALFSYDPCGSERMGGQSSLYSWCCLKKDNFSFHVEISSVLRVP